jgi:hypothetical protein
MIALKIDDPLDAFAVHAGGGAWGLLAVCIIGKEGIAYSIVDDIDGDSSKLGQAFAQLGWNLICALAIIIWSSLIMIPVFLFLKKIKKFRVIPEVEIKGLDIFKHGEAAYPIHAYGHGWDDIVSEDGRSRARTFSANAEFSLEELAAAYERRTSVIPNQMSRRISYYHNPAERRFEHPEHHQKALKNNSKKTKTANGIPNGRRVGPLTNELYAASPIPQIIVQQFDEEDEEEETAENVRQQTNSDEQHF